MGMDHNVYVGAYLEIEAPITEYGSSRCPNGHAYQVGDFCPRCGAQKETVMVSRPARLWDIFADNENLTELNGEGIKESHILAVGNLSDKPGKPTHLRIVAQGAGQWPITPDMVEEYCDNFQEQYAEEIECLKDAMLKHQINFGVVFCYWY